MRMAWVVARSMIEEVGGATHQMPTSMELSFMALAFSLKESLKTLKES